MLNVEKTHSIVVRPPLSTRALDWAWNKARRLLARTMLAVSVGLSPLRYSPFVRAGYALGTLAASLTTSAPFPGQDRSQYGVWLFFKVTASGSYVANGDTLNLSSIAPAGCGGVPLIGSAVLQSCPIVGTSTHSGFLYFFLQGASQSTGKMQIFGTGSGNQNALAEIAAGPYAAGITGDNIQGQCFFVYGS